MRGEEHPPGAAGLNPWKRRGGEEEERSHQSLRAEREKVGRRKGNGGR